MELPRGHSHPGAIENPVGPRMTEGARNQVARLLSIDRAGLHFSVSQLVAGHHWTARFSWVRAET